MTHMIQICGFHREISQNGCKNGYVEIRGGNKWWTTETKTKNEDLEES